MIVLIYLLWITVFMLLLFGVIKMMIHLGSWFIVIFISLREGVIRSWKNKLKERK
jgi:hypothetical protein